MQDRLHLAREEEPIDVEVVATDGAMVIGRGGKRWIDFTGGWCVGNLGWGREEIRAAIRDFDGPDYVAPSMLYAPWAELAAELVAIAPGKMKKCFRATGGTEAVDFAIRAALAHTGRQAMMCLEHAYHGDSLGALTLANGDTPVFPFVRVRPPLDESAAERVERRLAQKDIAGFILEPVAMNLGVIAPEPVFMERVAAACRRYGTLLIFDEVACGFGRTGTLFAAERFPGIEPDMICLAKALTGGYAGIGAMLATKDVAESMDSYYSTYGWHPRSVAVALAVLRIWKEHGPKILEHVASLSGLFRERLDAMTWPKGTEIRVEGLAIAIEPKRAKDAEMIAERCVDNGLLVAGEDGRISLFPALTIDAAVARRGLAILGRVVGGL